MAAIRRLERSIYPGFPPSVLGEVGWTVRDGKPVEDKESFLVGCLGSPLEAGESNVYAVFPGESLADTVTDVEWHVKGASYDFGPGGSSTIVVRTDGAAPAGCVRVQATVHGTEAKTFLHSFNVSRPGSNPTSDFRFSQDLGGLPQGIAQFALHHLQGYLDAALRATCETRLPRPVLAVFAMCVAARDEPAACVASWFEGTELAPRASTGLTWLRPEIAATLIGPSGLDGPWQDGRAAFIPIVPTSDNYAEIAERYEKLPDAQKAHLVNLVRFPKSNVLMLCRLLSRIVYSKGLDVHDPAALQMLSSIYFDALNLRAQRLHGLDEPQPSVDPLRVLSHPFIDLFQLRAKARRVVAKLGANAVELTDPRAGSCECPYLRGWDGNPEDSLEHYGWTPADHLGDVLKATPAGPVGEFLLLDVGFWGDYNRELPQRNFAVIDGDCVYLCDLIPRDAEVDASQAGDELPANHECTAFPLTDNIRKLASKLWKLWRYSFRVLARDWIPGSPSETGRAPSTRRFVVVLPDMHLPVQWPPAHRRPFAFHRDRQARESLRRALRRCQEPLPDSMSPEFGPVSETRSYVQIYVTPGVPSNVAFSSPLTGPAQYTREEFEAEKALVDRALWRSCSWFYPPLPGDAPPVFPATLEEEQDGDADPAPAIDLAVLLHTLGELKRSASPDEAPEVENVQLVHVGDLMELWVNQEWLYNQFPYARDSEAFEGLLASASLYSIGEYVYSDSDHGVDAGLVQVVSIGASLVSLAIATIGAALDGAARLFQYRLAAGWSKIGLLSLDDVFPDIAKTDGGPLYVHHRWPLQRGSDEIGKRCGLLGRKAIGNQLAQATGEKVPIEIGARCRALLKQRIEQVRLFSLPLPVPAEEHPLHDLFASLTKEKKLEQVQVEGRTEYRWNQLVLTMMEDLDCRFVYGNHDGYRGDPFLNASLDHGDSARPSAEVASPYWYEDRLWVEHGHRWDRYNMDGVGAGAGVTNLVYYYHRRNLARADRVKERVVDAFREATIPGAIQWYWLLEKGNPGEWFPPTPWQSMAPPAGPMLGNIRVYVVGHSHSPDLVRVKVDRNSD